MASDQIVETLVTKYDSPCQDHSFTRKITLKQDLIQQVTIRGNVNQMASNG